MPDKFVSVVDEPYTDPTPGEVDVLLRGGITDPAVIVKTQGKNWTQDQRTRWARSFNAHANYLIDNAERARGERAEADEVARSRALAVQQSMPPVLRDAAGGLKLAAGDLAGMALSVMEQPVGVGQDSLADVLNRQLGREEEAYRAAGVQGGYPEKIQTAFRGAARSAGTAAVTAPLGPAGMIAGFAGSRASHAVTEGRDAGLTGAELNRYVGRAALIEGGVAGAFQAVGAGGLEKVLGSGKALTRESLGQFFKQTAFEVTEENLTEILDAYNQASSKVTGEVTSAQLAQILEQTTLQTLMTMGLGQGMSEARLRERRQQVADGMAARYDWTSAQARGVVDRAAKNGEFATRLAREVQDEHKLSADGLATWILGNEEAARTLVAAGASRTSWEAAGLPKRDGPERARVIGELRGLLAEYDAARATPEARPVVAQEAPVAPAELEPQAQQVAPEPVAPAPEAPAPKSTGVKAAEPRPVFGGTALQSNEEKLEPEQRADLATKRGLNPPVAPDLGEAEEVAPEPLDLPRARTGQPFSAKLLRGDGAAESPSAGRAPILGEGRYTTPERAYAEEYGAVSEHEVSLRNPLVIDNDSQWRALTKRAGWGSPNPSMLSPAQIEKQIAALRKQIEADGHDGVVVRVPPDETTGKILQRVFDVSQAVEFNPPKNTEKPAEPAQAEAPPAPTPTVSEPAGTAPPKPMPTTSQREKVLLALLAERDVPRTAKQVAELADVTEKVARKHLRELEKPTAVEHAEGSREIPGVLVKKVGGKWQATELAEQWQDNPLNHAQKAEDTGEALASQAAEDEAARTIRELEEKIKKLEGDDSFEFGANRDDDRQFAPDPRTTDERRRAAKRDFDRGAITYGDYIRLRDALDARGGQDVDSVLARMRYEEEDRPAREAKERAETEARRAENAKADAEFAAKLRAQEKPEEKARRLAHERKSDRSFAPVATAASRPASPVKAASAENVSAREVIDTITDLWTELSSRGPATFREFKGDKILGFYSASLGEMRTKKDVHEVATKLHELGHHFDRQMGKWSANPDHSAAIKKELEQLGRDLYGNVTPRGKHKSKADAYRSEGFAEFMREYLIQAPDLQARAPELYRTFTTEYLPARPGEAKKLNKLQAKVVLFRTQTDEQFVDAFTRPPKRDWSLERLLAKLAAFEGRWVKAVMPIWRAMKATGAKLTFDAIPPRDHPVALITAYQRAAGGRAKAAALTGIQNVWGEEVGPPLGAVLAPILQQGPEVERDFIHYLVCDVALLRMNNSPKNSRGESIYNPGIPREVAERIVAKHKDRPGFKETAKAFTDWSHASLLPLVQSGAMTKATYDKIVRENTVYAYFLRHVKVDAGGWKGSGGKAIYGLTERGSNDPIHDPIDAALIQYENVQKKAMKADVVQALVRFYDQHRAQGDVVFLDERHRDGTFDDEDAEPREVAGKAPNLGKLLSEVPVPKKATTFAAEQIRGQVLEAAGEDQAEEVDAALAGLWDENLTVFTPDGKAGKEVISVWDANGKRRDFEVGPALVPILEGITRDSFLGDGPGGIGKALRAATQLVRVGATGLNPRFGAVTNLLKDTGMATVTGDYHTHIPLVSTLRGIYQAVRGSVTARQVEVAGLGGSGYFGQDGQAAKDLAGQIKRPGRIGRVVRPIVGRIAPGLKDVQATADLTKPIDFFWTNVSGLREVLGVSESGPRVMEYADAHAAGMERFGDSRDATILAACAMRDVTTDFPGSGTSARQVNEVIPFFSAVILGTEKVVRAFGGREAMPWQTIQSRGGNFRRSTVRSLGSITAASVLLYLLFNKDDKEWEELPPHRKWGALNVKIGGQKISLPLPHTVGQVFGGWPIAAVEEWRGKKGALAEAMALTGRSISPVDVFSGWHGLFRSVSLLAPGADVMANEDWKGDPIVKPQDQGKLERDQHGPDATGVALAIGQLAPGNGVSPAKIDHALNTATGGIWLRMAGMIKDMSDPSRVDLSDPSGIPMLGVLFLRPGTSRLPNDFYDRLDLLKRKERSKALTLEERGELDAAKETNEELSRLWTSRGDLLGSGKPASETRAEAEALIEKILQRIRDHNARDASSDRGVGLGNLVRRLTDPSHDKPEEWSALEGVTIEEAAARLRENHLDQAVRDRMRKGMSRAGARADALHDGALRLRHQNGKPTALGERMERLRRALRARQPAAPSSAAGS